MELYGMDETQGTEENTENEKVVSFEEKKSKRKPFAIWTVKGEDYRLKLKADMICKLEDKYRTNILNLVTSEGIPPLSVMLTITQGALTAFHHGIKIGDVQTIYEDYLEEGGSQMALLTDVILPIMSVSGFFTESMSRDLLNKMKSMDEMI